MGTLNDALRFSQEAAQEKDAFGIEHCRACGAVGTIVALGACCRIRALEASADPKFRWQAATERS